MARVMFPAMFIVFMMFIVYTPVTGSKKRDPEMTMQDGMMMIKGGKKGEMMIVGDDCSPIKFMHKSGKGKRGSMVMIMNKGSSNGCCKQQSGGCNMNKKTVAIPVMMVESDYGNNNMGGYGGSNSMGGGYSGSGSMGGGGYGESSGNGYEDSMGGGY